MKFASGLAIALALFVSHAHAQESGDSNSDVTVLYGGGDLSGWAGRTDLWSAENGEIVGRTSDEKPIDDNTFLVWQGGQPDNFELTAMFKIEGGNSGIQYRSKVIDEEKFVVSGYQADVDFTNKFAGILYEEKGRGILAKRGEKVAIDSKGETTSERFGDETGLAAGIHPGQWNEFRVVANGNHLQHFINETLTAEVIDGQSDKAATKGVIALQIHQGPAMTVRFKNIKIRQLK